MKNTATKYTSNRFLIILFLIAIPVFIALRWDSSAWLSTQINQAAKNNGVTIAYDQLSLSGLGITFTNLQFSRPNKASFSFDSMNISLSLSELSTGNLGADIQALWQGNPIAFTITQHDGLFDIQNINAQADMAQASTFMANVPAKLSGLVDVQGSLQISQASQQLQSADLSLTWQQAMAGLAQPEFTLGDYQAHLKSPEDNTSTWVWDVSGGSGVALDGKGTMLANQQSPRFWALTGEVSVQVDQSNPSLAMMIQAIAGSSQAKLRLSGSLANPRTVMIR